MEFKDKVKIVRKKFYLSQEMMAKELGVAFATVNRWESGRCKPNYNAQRAFANFCKAHCIDVETLEDIPSDRQKEKTKLKCDAKASHFLCGNYF